jgi:type IV pilus assembly protein PilP
MRLFGLLAVVMLSMLAGCAGEHEDIKRWMDESSRDLRGKIPPLPELRPFPVVSYEGAGESSDPFSASRLEPEKKESSGGANKPDFDRPREQLESFPLESLQFIGVISKNKGKEHRALIKVDGVIYQAGKGNYLGQNYGRITEINDTEVILKENLQDPSGQTADWVERLATLQLLDGAAGKGGGK